MSAARTGDLTTIRSPIERAFNFLRRHRVILVPLVIYAALIIVGVTTSSIGAPFLREDPAAPLGFQLGQSQLIRSDEYNTESALWLGQMAEGFAQLHDPLSVSPAYFAQLPAGPVSGIVFFDGTLLMLGPWLPDAMLFAMKWWLPTVLLFIGMPVWFKQITGKYRWGYLAAVLIFFSPSSMWWSGRPVNTIGFIVAGCALGIFAARRLVGGQWIAGVLSVGAAGILLARFPSYYQPLAIVVGPPIVLATAGYLFFANHGVRNRLLALGPLALSGAAFTLFTALENWDSLSAVLATVYPGDRRSTGQGQEIGAVFGATNFGWMESVGTTALNTNQTEIASSFTILLVVIGFAFVAQRWNSDRATAAALIPLVVLATFWLTWCTVSWGAVGEMIPLANRVPYYRATNATGFVATIAFCLYMTQWRTPQRRAVPAVAGGVAALASAVAGSSLQAIYLPDLATWMIWLSAAAVGLVIFALLQWPDRWYSLAAAGLAASVMTATAVPVLFGLADLRASDAASDFLSAGRQAREAGAVWATDSFYVDALLTATGTPSLSARQQMGPDRHNWLRLDPEGTNENTWNRAGMYYTFDWTNAPEIKFSNPSPDILVMTASPCTVAQRIPELDHIVSGKELDMECLELTGEFNWSGSQHWIYAVHHGGA